MWSLRWHFTNKSVTGAPYSIQSDTQPNTMVKSTMTETVPSWGRGGSWPIPVLGSQPAGDASHKPGGRLPLLSARPAVTLETLNRAATNFAAWWTEARWVWTVCLRLLPDSIVAVIWTQALLCLSPARWPLGHRATRVSVIKKHPKDHTSKTLLEEN